jgi:predicted lipase
MSDPIFKKVNILKCIRFTRYSHREKFSDPELKNIHHFDIENIEGYTATHREYFVVCFRGSESFYDPFEENDWFKTNFVFTKIPKGNSRIPRFHKGFYKGWSLVQYHVFKRFVASKKEKILFIGHSLGAALAEVGSYFTKEHFNGAKVLCVAFAPPRVGNRKFANIYETLVDEFRIFRFASDPVPRVPSSFFGFKHPCFIHLKWTGPKRTIFEWFKDFPNDHNWDRYEKAIEEQYEH